MNFKIGTLTISYGIWIIPVLRQNKGYYDRFFLNSHERLNCHLIILWL